MTMLPTGKAAASFMEAMRGMPLVLALCVMNGALIGFAYYQASAFNSQRKDNVALMVDIQRDAQKLLSQCIVPVRPPQ
jgi:hypothetical protein